ncbi:MAG: methylthioribulose 1-phosphate dehydratase [Gammaproteobacteria bacterium]|nr:methylthioribulose 1-phosphate dehydratase [Gammaproteobacteria bacterium]
MHDTRSFESSAQALVRVGQQAFAQGWVPATSGNFSCRLDDETVAITVSGKHKGFLTLDDIMLVDYSGRSLDGKRPSAETLLHLHLYRREPKIGAVLHTHSISSTVLSRAAADHLVLDGLEVLKAFDGIDSHESQLTVPVFANDQDIARMASMVDDYMDKHPPIAGYLIAGHGLYTWGRSVNDTLRHLEAFEFLFQCELEFRRIKAS